MTLHPTVPAASTLAALLLSAALLAPPAATAAPDPAAVAGAMAEFMRAAGGSEAAIEPAARQLTALSQAEPADPVLRAYAGAAVAMQARTTMLPWKKMGYAEDGLAMIDKSLAQLTPAHDAPRYRGVPASLEARFTAAGTFLALPSMFNRQARGERLLQEVLASPLLEASPMGFKAAVWLRAGLEAARAQRSDEARTWLQKAADSGTPAAAAAQARLKEL